MSSIRPPPATPSSRTAEKDEPSEDAGQNATSRWIVDELTDVGPAGPSAATTQGVLFVTREGELLLARFQGELPRQSKPAKTKLEPVTVEAARFVRSGVGPAVMGGAAYFVTGGRLVRKRLADDNAVDVLATDAREGSRVAAPAPATLPGHDPGPMMVAYLARAGDRSVAKLWVEGASLRELSPEGTSISSVALARNGNDFMAVSLEGRTSMSPVHARRIRTKDGGVLLGSDVVVWVGGSAQALTELTAIAVPIGGVHVFLPLERDMTHFGLARLEIDAEPHMDAEVWWRNYPNGVEPAVTAAAWLCGEPVVLYARPADATPHAPEELALASVTTEGLGAPTVVSRGRLVTNASLAALPQGALVSYVADRRTWACTVRCGRAW